MIFSENVHKPVKKNKMPYIIGLKHNNTNFYSCIKIICNFDNL